MGSWHTLGGVGAARSAAAIAVALLLAVPLAFGCGPERPPRPPPSEKVVAAGDIASCSGTADEATAGLVGGIEGATVLALGDEAYPEGTEKEFDECYEPAWGRFEERTRPVPGNHAVLHPWG